MNNEEQEMEIISSFPTVSLGRLKILEILDANHQTLDYLSQDLVQMLNYPLTSELFMMMLVEDLYILSALSCEEVSSAEIDHELRQLLADIQYRVREFKPITSLFLNLSFEMPDTMRIQIRKVRSRSASMDLGVSMANTIRRYFAGVKKITEAKLKNDNGTTNPPG